VSGQFGYGPEVSRDTSGPYPNCLGTEVSWSRSVRKAYDQFPEHARQLCKMALALDRREFLRVNEAHEILLKAVASDSGT